MPVAHYDASIAYDQKVKRGVPGQVARVYHPITDLPIDDLLDLDGNPIAALVSNSQGFVEPFEIVDGPGHVKMSVGSLRYYIVDLNLVGESAASAVQAALAAQRAADLVEAPVDEVVKTLIEGETLAGEAGDARWVTQTGADIKTADLIEQPNTLTKSALNAAYVSGVSINKTGNKIDLQNAIDAAAVRNTILYLSGSYSINSPLVVPKKLTVLGTGPGLTITQTSPLTPIFSGAGVDDMTVADVTLVGVGTDYVNNDTVYGASAFKFSGNNGRIHLSNVAVKGIAGAGVFVGAGTTRRVILTNSEITGIGRAALGTSNYSAGVVVQDGVDNVTIEECEISGIAQGVSIGHGCKRVTLSGNRIHDTSEHGAYLASSDFYTVVGNTFYNTGLLGLKIQKGLAGYTSKSAIISDNHFDSTGSTAIMLTNAIDSTVAITSVTLNGNVITNCADTGIRIDNARGVKAAGNTINGARFGIRIYASSVVALTDNDILNTERTGMLIDNSSRVKVNGGTLLNLGILGPEKVGIIVQGVVDNLLLDGVTVDYDIAAQNDGLLFGSGTFTNIRIRGGYYRGANWGMRTASAASGVTQWRDNFAVGGIGTVDGVPVFVPTLGDSAAGTTLEVLVTEVNKIKKILRDQKDAR